MTFRTRFAPSPSGPLHLGHAYSALTAYRLARKSNGTFLLRIEDIDQTRARSTWVNQIYEDLAWLGLSWPTPVTLQSQNMAAYQAALDTLWDMGVLYACTCNRRDVLNAMNAPQEGAPVGPDGLIYPGTCRDANKEPNSDTALRLNAHSAFERVGDQITFTELGSGPNGETGQHTMRAETFIKTIGDVVLSRKGMGTSYHLSVVVDDAHQDITHVVRGQDLFEATMIHVLLQRLLGYPTPDYHHHRLVRDASGKRLAKRDNARALSTLRDDGLSPDDVKALLKDI